MKQNSSKGQKPRKAAYHGGAGLVIGAAIGMIFGLLLFGNPVWGIVIGAAVGLMVDAVIDAQG